MGKEWDKMSEKEQDEIIARVKQDIALERESQEVKQVLKKITKKEIIEMIVVLVKKGRLSFWDFDGAFEEVKVWEE